MAKSLLILITVLHLTAWAQPQPQPDLIIELCRHGARAPTQADFDPTWSQSELGQLLPAGMRQHYILGQELLKTYPNILGQPFSWDKVFILSDLYNRTIQSASSQLYGIYQGKGPGLGVNFNAEVAVPPYNQDEANKIISNLTDSAALPYNYDPIVIPVVNISNFTQGTLFGTIGFESCPNFGIWMEENLVDKNAQQFWVIFNETIKNLNNFATAPLTNGLDVADFADTVYANTMAGKPLPGGMPSDNTQLITNMTFAYSWWMTYLFQGQPVENYVSAYELVVTILSYVQGAINGTNLNNFMLLSGHDGNVAAVLGALGMLNAEQVMANFNASSRNETQPYPFSYWPPFASSLIFELYNTTEPYVKVIYNGEAIPLCNGGTECAWSQFEWIMMNGIGNYTLDDVDRVCGHTQDVVDFNYSSSTSNSSSPSPIGNGQPSSSNTVFIVVIILLVIALGVALGKIIYDHKKQKQESNRAREGLLLLDDQKNIL